MRLQDVVHPDWLEMRNFEGLVYRCVETINAVYARSELDLKVIPNNVSILLRSYRTISPQQVKAVMLGIEPPYGKPYRADWFYNGVPFDTPRFMEPSKVTRRMLRRFDLGITPTTAYGYLDNLYERGLLLTNASLSCTQGFPRTHLRVWWQYFTRPVIMELARIRPGILVAVASSELFAMIGRIEGARVVRVTSPALCTGEAFLKDSAYRFLTDAING